MGGMWTVYDICELHLESTFFFLLPVFLRGWSRSGGEHMCKGGRVMSQTGCAGETERSTWGTLAGWEAEL